MNEISKRLQQFYEQSGLSYADLALRTGVPKSALQRYISGTTEKIPMDRLEKLAYALDTTPQVLMGWQHDENSDIPPGFSPLPEMRRVPFKNMIYIADGPSDIPAFSLINSKGGATFAVYPHGNNDAFRQVESLRKDGRVQMYGEADYSENTLTYLSPSKIPHHTILTNAPLKENTSGQKTTT